MHRQAAKVRVVPDAQRLAAGAAGIFVTAAGVAVTTRGRFVVALSGGSTPQSLFALLAEPPYRQQVPWRLVHIFWGDERLVPAKDPGSNYFHARRLLLDRVPVPASHIQRVQGELSPAAATADYTRRLRSYAPPGKDWPHFDLAIMGLGADGHTASLFPGTPAIREKSQPVLHVRAEYEGRPAERITLTPPVFNDARQVLFLAAGAAKADAVAAVLYGERDPDKWPAQAIQPHSGALTWLVDKEAAGQFEAD